jgi:hypothetical protein
LLDAPILAEVFPDVEAEAEAETEAAFATVGVVMVTLVPFNNPEEV